MTATAEHSMTDRLLDAFLETDYLVHWGEQVTAVRIGQSHSALDEQLGGSSWAIITAHNPGGSKASDASNQARTQALDQAIETAGVKAIPTINRAGNNDWPDEPGRLLIDPLPEWIHATARQLGQLGVVRGRCNGVAELWLCDDGSLAISHAHVLRFPT